MLKLTSLPLALPPCCVDDVLLAPATWVITGTVPLKKFQSKVISAAPSASPLIAIAVRLPTAPDTEPPAVGVTAVSLPVPSNVNDRWPESRIRRRRQQYCLPSCSNCPRQFLRSQMLGRGWCQANRRW